MYMELWQMRLHMSRVSWYDWTNTWTGTQWTFSLIYYALWRSTGSGSQKQKIEQLWNRGRLLFACFGSIRFEGPGTMNCSLLFLWFYRESHEARESECSGSWRRGSDLWEVPVILSLLNLINILSEYNRQSISFQKWRPFFFFEHADASSFFPATRAFYLLPPISSCWVSILAFCEGPCVPCHQCCRQFSTKSYIRS